MNGLKGTCFEAPSFCSQEKARKPRGKGEEEPKAEGEGGKVGSAAQGALDAMEQLVNTLAHGKEERFFFLHVRI